MRNVRRFLLAARTPLISIGLVVVTGTGCLAHDATVSTLGPHTDVNATYDPYAGTQPAVAATGTVSEGSLSAPDGRSRHYRLYVPTTITTGQPIPLVIALHGGLGTSAQFAANSGFDDLAEANRFVVVYPDGIGALPDGTGFQTWNGGYCCGPAVARNVDDVGFIRQLIGVLTATLPIDPARVYAAGHSNGAIMAYRLACELSDRIAAIGVQSGSLGVDTCTPPRPVSVIHIHGTADTNHPIDGGLGSGISGVVFRPARDAAEALAAADGCSETPTTSADPSNADLDVSTWTACRADAAVRFVVVAGATHAWMGHESASAGAAAYVGVPYPDLDASRAIWSFLTAHAAQTVPLTIVTATLPDASLGRAYSRTIAATGGRAPLTVKVSGVPKGLKFDRTSATLAGTPKKAGTFTLTVKVSDGTKPKKTTVTRTLTLRVQVPTASP